MTEAEVLRRYAVHALRLGDFETATALADHADQAERRQP